MRLLAVLGVFAAVVAVAVAAPVKEPRKVIEPAVQARAKRIAVQLGDLAGFGWKVEPSQADRSSPKCSYYDPDQSHLSENGDYTSPDFTRSDGVYVSSSIGIFVSAAHAKTSYAEVVRPELPRCLGEIIAKADRPGKITVRSAGKLSFPRYGDRSAAFRVVFSVKSGKTLVPATIDIVAINRGDVDAAVIFGSVGAPVPAQFERQIAGKVAARITS
jgi:hypothetical protein